jgi:hypothetical protein
MRLIEFAEQYPERPAKIDPLTLARFGLLGFLHMHLQLRFAGGRCRFAWRAGCRGAAMRRKHTNRAMRAIVRLTAPSAHKSPMTALAAR